EEDLPRLRRWVSTPTYPSFHSWRKGDAVLGFRFGWFRHLPGPGRPAGDAGYDAVVPLPALLVVFAAMPGWWTVQRMKRTRRREGTCPACGYDLRATPYQCSECGTEVQKGSA